MRSNNKRIRSVQAGWHHAPMPEVRIAALIIILLAGASNAEMLEVRGQVTGEDGAAINSLTVQVDGQTVAVDDDGKFLLTVDSDSARVFQLKASAVGFYSALQTLHASDFAGGANLKLPLIELVQRKAGRQLIMFAGDAMLSRRYFKPLPGEPVLVRPEHVEPDSRALLQHIKPYVDLADFASVNLETQLSKSNLKNRLPKSVTFYSPPEFADSLKWAGFDYAALGNNHMFDYQDEGLRSTFSALDRSGLLYSGGGFNDVAARQPAVTDVDGNKLALLSYVGWPGTFSPSQAAEKDKGGAALGDHAVIGEDLSTIPDDATAIVQLHAGLEYSAHPAVSEQTTLRQAIVDGADVVLGHHAHVLQGFEIYQDRLIAYSLGNFLFDQYHYTTQLGMLLFVWMDGDRLHRAEVVPLHLNGYLPTPATGAFRYSVLHRLRRLSDPDSVCMRESGLHATITACDAQTETAMQRVDAGSMDVGEMPIALRKVQASALAPVSVVNAKSPYRLGTDILRRGDFEYAGLFGTHDRTWIENRNVRVSGFNGKQLHIVVDGDSVVRTGQKVFERVFTASNPATVSGQISVRGNVRLRVLLQRRRIADALTDALANGPLSEIGSADFGSDGEFTFTFDYRQPRIATRSVRLLFEIEDMSGEGADVDIDDISWVEWATPWRQSDEAAKAVFATHLQFQQ